MNLVAWHPAASMETLRLRADMLAAIRRFFAERHVLEVDTPALSVAGAPEPALESVRARVDSLGEATLFLQTSPEHAMKRLLTAGSGDIFQVCRVYRDAELGRWHEPEFTLLEWYRVGWDELELMSEVDTLLSSLLSDRRALAPTVRMSYQDAFLTHVGVDPLAAEAELTQRLERAGVDVPAGLEGEALADLALAGLIAPALDPDALTFIFDFPAGQAQLARIKSSGDRAVAARFEVFLAGLELGNGFAELTDAAEQRARFEAQLDARRRDGRVTPPLDEAFLAALAHGLPECAGVAIGLDRVVALAGRLSSVAEAMAFPHRGDQTLR